VQQRVRAGRVPAPHVAQPKVGQLDVAVGGQQHVFGLEVPVEDAARVAVAQRRRQLAQGAARGGLAERPARGHALKQVSPRDQLHHHEDLVLGAHHLNQAHHVWVPHAAQDLDLAAHLVHHAGAHQVLLVQHLDGHRMPGVHVLRVLDLGVGALRRRGGAGRGGRRAAGGQRAGHLHAWCGAVRLPVDDQ
jgi:hypothetical protein